MAKAYRSPIPWSFNDSDNTLEVVNDPDRNLYPQVQGFWSRLILREISRVIKDYTEVINGDIRTNWHASPSSISLFLGCFSTTIMSSHLRSFGAFHDTELSIGARLARATEEMLAVTEAQIKKMKAFCKCTRIQHRKPFTVLVAVTITQYPSDLNDYMHGVQQWKDSSHSTAPISIPRNPEFHEKFRISTFAELFEAGIHGSWLVAVTLECHKRPPRFLCLEDFMAVHKCCRNNIPTIPLVCVWLELFPSSPRPRPCYRAGRICGGVEGDLPRIVAPYSVGFADMAEWEPHLARGSCGGSCVRKRWVQPPFVLPRLAEQTRKSAWFRKLASTFKMLSLPMRN